MNAVRSKTILILIGFFILLATVVLYGPMLRQPFCTSANDQLWFFAEMRQAEASPQHLPLLLWDYSEYRYWQKGDTFLFRPLYIAWLVLLDKLFSYHYVLWALVSLCLHTLNLFLFYRLLKTVGPPLPAAATVLVFSLNPLVGYLVTNHHWVSYLLAIAFFLMSFRDMQSLAFEAVFPRSRFVRYLLILTVGVFMYEMLGVFSALMAGFILWNRYQKFRERDFRFAVSLLLPVIVFLSVYIPRTFLLDRSMMIGDELRPWDLVSPKRLIEIAEGLKVGIQFYARHLFPLEASLWRMVAVVLAVFFLLRPGLNRLFLKSRLGLLIFLGLMNASYHFYLLLFRATLIGRGHYCYLGYLLFFFFVFALVDWERLQKKRAVVLAVCWLLFTAATFRHSLSSPRSMMVYDAGADRYFSALNGFVDQHKEEPDFSFYVENPSDAWDEVFWMCPGYYVPEKPLVPMRVSEVVYAPYYREQGARYAVRFDPEGRLVIRRADGGV